MLIIIMIIIIIITIITILIIETFLYFNILIFLDFNYILT